VFLDHYQDDDVIPIEEGRAFSSTLIELGMYLEWKVYEEGGHWVNGQEGVDDIANFMRLNMHLDAAAEEEKAEPA
jgi:predicted esterase